MLTTQLLGASPAGFLSPMNGLGAEMSSPAIKSLQTYLISRKKIPQDQATGVINDITMAAIFNEFIATAEFVSKLSLLDKQPDVKSAITEIVTTLKDANAQIESWTKGFFNLYDLFRHFTDVTALIRGVGNEISEGRGDQAADAALKMRDTIYNAVGGQAAIIEKALRVIFPAGTTPQAGTPGAPGTTTSGGRKITAHVSPDVLKSLTTGTVLKASPVKASPVKAGTVYAFSKKLGKYRVAVPKVPVTTPTPTTTTPPKTAGLGFGIMRDTTFGGGQCIFGDCGLGQAASATFTETAPSTTAPAAPARQVTEAELEKLTGTTPFYKKPLFWVATIGGVAAVGGGYWYIRRRRTVPAAKAA